MTSQAVTWYDTSPDAGPECLCSLKTCGQPIDADTVPIRVFDEATGREARFHPGCYSDFLALTQAAPAWNAEAYNGGLPFYWADESTDLPAAVNAFLAGQATPAQLARVVQYLDYYIQAPVWRGDDALDDLRRRAPGLTTADEISAWIHRCLEIGLDPL